MATTLFWNPISGTESLKDPPASTIGSFAMMLLSARMSLVDMGKN